MKKGIIYVTGVLLAVLSCSKKEIPDRTLEDLALSREEIVMEPGETETLEVMMTPSDADAEIVWSSSDASVASVIDGKVTAHAEGQAVVKAASGRFMASCTVTVRDTRLHVEVGYYYCTDGTVSDAVPSDKDIAGLVYTYDEDSGKCMIVSLNQGYGKWSTVYEKTGADDVSDGKANTEAVHGLDGWEENYPSFLWIEENCISGPEWYMPSKREMKELFAAVSGLRISSTETGEGFVSDWEDETDMPGYGSKECQSSRTRFNQRLIDAGGARLGGFYSTSTEGGEMDVWLFNFNFGRTYVSGKSFERSVRAVACVEIVAE